MAHGVDGPEDSGTCAIGWHARPAMIAPRRILIVEDEQDMREFLDRVLREAGYVTARVIDGQEGLDIATLVGHFDLLLTDVVMPRISGTELARRLRQTDPGLKVLYFTGYRNRLIQEKGTLWENEACLEKPSTVDDLLEAISRLLYSDVTLAASANGDHQPH